MKADALSRRPVSFGKGPPLRRLDKYEGTVCLPLPRTAVGSLCHCWQRGSDRILERLPNLPHKAPGPCALGPCGHTGPGVRVIRFALSRIL